MISTALMSLPLLLATHLTPQVARAEVVRGETAERIDRFLTRLEGVGFSGVIGVRTGGELVLSKGYGLADREAGRRMTPDTVVTVGSITKQFTAAAILLLESQGKLTVGDRLDKHFEDVPGDKAGITLHQLLTHTAGFPGAIGGDFDTTGTAEQFLREAFGTELLFPPGADYEYTNVGYSLLGILVERISGRPYETFLARNLFRPAGMKHTGYLAPRYAADDLAVGYTNEGRWGTVLERPMLADGPSWHLRANGGIHSTVGDMLKWRAALETDAVLDAEARRKMLTPHVSEGGDSHYGYGWAIDETDWGAKRIAHNGGNTVFFADLHHYPDDDLTLFFATNVARAFGELTPLLVDLLFDYDVDLPPATIAIDDNELGAFSGSYRLDRGNALHVEASGGRLLARAEGAGLIELLTGHDAKLAQRTETIADGIGRGDLAEFLAAFGGERSPAELEEIFAGIRSQQIAAMGPFTGVGSVGGRSGAETWSFAELRFERSSEFLLFAWQGDKISEVMLESEAPWETGGGAAKIALFPVGPNRFVEWSLRGGTGAELSFDESSDAGATLTRHGRSERLKPAR